MEQVPHVRSAEELRAYLGEVPEVLRADDVRYLETINRVSTFIESSLRADSTEVGRRNTSRSDWFTTSQRMAIMREIRAYKYEAAVADMVIDDYLVNGYRHIPGSYEGYDDLHYDILFAIIDFCDYAQQTGTNSAHSRTAAFVSWSRRLDAAWYRHFPQTASERLPLELETFNVLADQSASREVVYVKSLSGAYTEDYPALFVTVTVEPENAQSIRAYIGFMHVSPGEIDGEDIQSIEQARWSDNDELILSDIQQAVIAAMLQRKAWYKDLFTSAKAVIEERLHIVLDEYNDCDEVLLHAMTYGYVLRSVPFMRHRLQLDIQQ